MRRSEMKEDMHPIEPEELMAYLDGELSSSRASEAAQHLSTCRECQMIAGDLQSVSRKLVDWQIDEPGPRVERVVNLERPFEKTRPIWKRGSIWVGGVAACIVVAMVVRQPLYRNTALGFAVRQAQFAAPTAPPSGSPSTLPQTKARLPLVIRTAQITLTTSDFSKARTALEEILRRRGGHIGNLTVTSPADSGQTLDATLRIPASQLDAALVEIRKLGRVETEQQGGEEVTQQMVDLEARLANARNTEQRLTDILRHSTGKVTDILAVEQEIDRVRGEIEKMEAERKNLGDRVDFATLEVRINEEYKAHLSVAAPSTFSRLRNAAIEGYRNAADSLLGIAMVLLSEGPALLLWVAILFFPARYAWRKRRNAVD